MMMLMMMLFVGGRIRQEWPTVPGQWIKRDKKRDNRGNRGSELRDAHLLLSASLCKILGLGRYARAKTQHASVPAAATLDIVISRA